MTARRAWSDDTLELASGVPRRGRLGVRTESWLVRFGVLGLLIFAGWRVTLGASLSDDGHAVALAWRMSLGDAPLSYEMNIQALGSLPAVPFTWLWTHVFGLSGLMLASRLWFVLLAFAAGVLAYRALRTRFRPTTAAIAVAIPLLALPYNLPVVSYNTVPVLALVLGTASGFAAIQRSHIGWAVLCGATTAAGVASLPQMLPGAALLAGMVLLLVPRWRVRIAVLGGLLAVALPFLVWLIVGPGLPGVQRTLDFTSQYQGMRAPPMERLSDAIHVYWAQLIGPPFWPMWVAVVLAAVPVVPRVVRAVALVLVPLLAAIPCVVALADVSSGIAFGKFVGTYVWIVDLALVVPVGVWTARRRDKPTLTLIALSLPVALVQVPIVAALTSSRVEWGVHALGAASLTMAVTVGWLESLRAVRDRLGVVAGLVLVGVVAGLMSAKPFYDPYPWQLTSRITSGPFAGIATTPARAAQIQELTRMGERYTEPGDGVLFYGGAGVYLLTEGRPVTPILWLSNFGDANSAALEYFAREGRSPDVVFISTNLLAQAGGMDRLAAQDPLVAYFSRYREATPRAGGGEYVVLVRR